jgi:hypothetical protein
MAALLLLLPAVLLLYLSSCRAHAFYSSLCSTSRHQHSSASAKVRAAAGPIAAPANASLACTERAARVMAALLLLLPAVLLLHPPARTACWGAAPAPPAAACAAPPGTNTALSQQSRTPITLPANACLQRKLAASSMLRFSWQCCCCCCLLCCCSTPQQELLAGVPRLALLQQPVQHLQAPTPVLLSRGEAVADQTEHASAGVVPAAHAPTSHLSVLCSLLVAGAERQACGGQFLDARLESTSRHLYWSMAYAADVADSTPTTDLQRCDGQSSCHREGPPPDHYNSATALGIANAKAI